MPAYCPLFLSWLYSSSLLSRSLCSSCCSAISSSAPRHVWSLAQKAIETGQPIPENLCGKQAVPAADLWRTGIRNVSIGAGLVLMFAIWGSAFLVGIGALVLCYGVGQAGHREDQRPGRR